MRRLRWLLAVLASVLLTGCTVEGTVDITLDTVTVDLTIHAAAAEGFDQCPGQSYPPSISRTVERAGPGVLRCHYSGTMTVDEAVRDGYLARSDADSLLVVFLPNQRWPAPPGDDPGTIDLTISLPGEVTVANASGEVTGHQVRFTDSRAVLADGIGLVAHTRGNGANIWGWGLLGVLSGLAATLGVAWLMRWPRRPGALAGAPAHELLGEPKLAFSDAGDTAAPAGQAHTDPSPDAPPGDGWVPDTEPPPDAEPPEDPSVWASED